MFLLAVTSFRFSPLSLGLHSWLFISPLLPLHLTPTLQFILQDLVKCDTALITTTIGRIKWCMQLQLVTEGWNRQRALEEPQTSRFWSLENSLSPQAPPKGYLGFAPSLPFPATCCCCPTPEGTNVWKRFRGTSYGLRSPGKGTHDTVSQRSPGPTGPGPWHHVLVQTYQREVKGMGQSRELAWRPLLWLVGHEEGQVAFPQETDGRAPVFLESNPEHTWICSVAARWGALERRFLGSRLGAVLCGSQGSWGHGERHRGSWDLRGFPFLCWPDKDLPCLPGVWQQQAPFPFSQPSTPSWPQFITSLLWLWSIPWRSGLMKSVRNTVLGLFEHFCYCP